MRTEFHFVGFLLFPQHHQLQVSPSFLDFSSEGLINSSLMSSNVPLFFCPRFLPISPHIVNVERRSLRKICSPNYGAVLFVLTAFRAQ